MINSLTWPGILAPAEWTPSATAPELLRRLAADLNFFPDTGSPWERGRVVRVHCSNLARDPAKRAQNVYRNTV